MSTKALLVVLLGAVIAIGVLVVVVRHIQNELRIVRCQLTAAEKERDEYAALAANLRKYAEVSNGNRKEAEQKIDELHTGDAVGNALDGLRKRQGGVC